MYISYFLLIHYLTDIASQPTWGIRHRVYNDTLMMYSGHYIKAFETVDGKRKPKRAPRKADGHFYDNSLSLFILIMIGNLQRNKTIYKTQIYFHKS